MERRDQIEALFKGLDAEILGGDTKEGEETVISGTVLGKQQKSIVRRRADGEFKPVETPPAAVEAGSP